MPSAKELKDLRLLRHKKYRQAQRRYLIEGPRLIVDALASGAPVSQIFYTADFTESDFWHEISSAVSAPGITVVEITPSQAGLLRTTRHTQGVFAVLPMPEPTEDPKRLLEAPILVLDDISDPGNLGTLLRIADWFGMPTVWISAASADLFNPKVVRSAMGAHFHIKNIYKGELEPLSRLLTANGIFCLGAAIHGEQLGSITPVDDKWALVLGNEARGLSKQWQKRLDKQVGIPGIGSAESLNVSVAAGIILYQLRVMNKPLLRPPDTSIP